MNADCDFRIGGSHDVCQDYATCGTGDDFAYAIVCDGCSSSPDVDFGARVLALAAREIIQEARVTPMDPEVFAKRTVRRADLVSAIFRQIHPQFLDATLLIAWVDRGELTAMMFGDGMFFHRTGNGGTVRAVRVDFKIPIDGNLEAAPDYPAYYLESLREQNYRALGGDKTVEDCLITKEGSSGTLSVRKPFDPVIIKGPVMPGDVISLCSDGINSFRRANREAIPWQDMVNDYIDFKSLPGVFVKRRFNFLQKRCKKEGLYHYDDISLASIAV